MSPADLLEVCNLWHNLSDEGQMQYLCTQHEASEEVLGNEEAFSRRTDYYINGSKVCVGGLCAILAVCPRTMYKKLKHGVDMRKQWSQDTWRPDRRIGRNLVDLFFMELYHSECEDLPEHLHIQDVDEAIRTNASITPDPSSDIFKWTPEAAWSDRAVHLIGPSPSVPRRHLPPGKVTTLFWRFQAWWEACEEIVGKCTELESEDVPKRKQPSWSTFWRTWAGKWTSILTFRKTSQHKECSTCFNLRANLHKKGPSNAQKKAWAREFQEHIRHQYHDRLLYWSLRWASRAFMNVLVLIIDSMDKVKTMYPKYRSHRKPAYLESLIRPRISLSAVLCHGWCTCVSLCDEEVHHGAAHFCELICRALDKVAEISKKTGRPMPEHLVIQADNTTAQCKNSVASVFLAYLVARGKFLTTTMNFLTVGHTHEDVNRLFALILLIVLQRYFWEVPSDLAEQLAQALVEHVRNKGEELDVQLIHDVRDFESWLAPLGITIHNAFVRREGKEASHSFSYKVRTDLSSGEVAALKKRRGVPEHPEDVFAIVKGRMHYTEAQPPVLCLPHGRFSNVVSSSPTKLLERNPLEAGRADKLQKLADTLRSMPEPYTRAADEIERKLRGGEDEPPPQLEWLSEAAEPREAVEPTGNQYFGHLPDTHWQLLATFHRTP